MTAVISSSPDIRNIRGWEASLFICSSGAGRKRKERRETGN
jgi:hypothetical protein